MPPEVFGDSCKCHVFISFYGRKMGERMLNPGYRCRKAGAVKMKGKGYEVPPGGAQEMAPWVGCFLKSLMDLRSL